MCTKLIANFDSTTFSSVMGLIDQLAAFENIDAKTFPSLAPENVNVLGEFADCVGANDLAMSCGKAAPFHASLPEEISYLVTSRAIESSVVAYLERAASLSTADELIELATSLDVEVTKEIARFLIVFRAWIRGARQLRLSSVA